MSDYRVELDCYHGPLDLLLYLVKRHEIDLHDIPIAELTDQYFKHLTLIKEVNVEQAAEFLVMAATLLEIKSAMLLPPAVPAPGSPGAGNEGEGEGPDAGGISGFDPRYELVQQLLQYKKFKDAARRLETRQAEWQERFPCQPLRRAAVGAGGSEDGLDGETDGQPGAEPVELDLEDVSVLDLCEAFARILETVGRGPGFHEVVMDDTPIALHAADILDRLGREGGKLTLSQIFTGRTRRTELIGLFLASLELVRQRKIRVVQEQAGGEMELEMIGPQEEQPPEQPPQQPPEEAAADAGGSVEVASVAAEPHPD